MLFARDADTSCRDARLARVIGCSTIYFNNAALTKVHDARLRRQAAPDGAAHSHLHQYGYLTTYFDRGLRRWALPSLGGQQICQNASCHRLRAGVHERRRGVSPDRWRAQISAVATRYDRNCKDTLSRRDLEARSNYRSRSHVTKQMVIAEIYCVANFSVNFRRHASRC